MKLLEPFGVRVLGFDPFCPPERATEMGVQLVALDELAAQSDAVVIMAALTEATRHLVNADLLAAMRPDAVLINVARGPIVDEAALVDALRSGEIAGAGLDVFEDEPAVHPGLLELENIALLPHLGSATVETRTAMAELAARNVLRVLAGEPAPTPVTARRSGR